MKKNIFGAFIFIIVFITACTSEKPLTPKETVKSFITDLSEGNCDEAIKKTIKAAKNFVKELQNDGCEKDKVSLKSVKCKTTETTAVCDCENKKDGIVFETTYTLEKKEEIWKISEIETFTSPEDVVKIFVKNLAKGNCENAMKIATGNAKETVQATIDAGCESYESDILSISCEIEEKTAVCNCEEDRSSMNMTYTYKLKLVNGAWKVESYEKDLDLNMDL